MRLTTNRKTDGQLFSSFGLCLQNQLAVLTFDAYFQEGKPSCESITVDRDVAHPLAKKVIRSKFVSDLVHFTPFGDKTSPQGMIL